jgi:hypothetical protein
MWALAVSPVVHTSGLKAAISGGARAGAPIAKGRGHEDFLS